NVVLGHEIRVVGAQGKRLPRSNGQKAFYAVSCRPTDILECSGCIVGSDQIIDVVVEIRGAKLDVFFERRLLEAQIIADARFRFQVRVPEEIEGREVLKQLCQGRRFEAGSDAALESRSGLGDQQRRGNAERGLAAERVIAVIANAGRIEESLAKARLQLDHARVVGDRRGGSGDLVALVLAA